ncbi:MAG: hypothetical protein LBM70_04230 [Victivallales bacterium]|jgi:hypothetical protein|nr:hypothetical protein [Victivallales bacterium]
MLYEFITSTRGGSISAHGNLVFLDKSDFDTGGSWYYTYGSDPYLYTTDPTPVYSPITLGNGSRLVLGNTQGDYRGDSKVYNLRVDENNIQGATNAVFFNGDGEVDFTPVTGNGKLGQVDKISPRTQTIRVTNQVDSSGWTIGTGTAIPGSQNGSAYGIRSTGKLTLLSDMSANFEIDSDLNLIPYRDTRTANAPPYNTSSGNLINSAAFRVGSMQIDNNFTGVLNVSIPQLVIHHYTGAVDNNEIGAYGVLADGAFTLGRIYRGVIDAQVGNVDLLCDNINLAPAGVDPKVASVSNNTVSAIGIKGSELNFNAFNSEFTNSCEIITDVQSVSMVAISKGGDGSSSSAADNEINSIAIDGGNVTFNGKFEATLDSTISDIAIGEYNGKVFSFSGNSYNLYGVRASGAFVANKNFDGTITLKFDSPYVSGKQASVIVSNVAGIRGSSITVTNGYLRSNITINVNDDLRCASTADYICGVRASTINAAAFDGVISVTSDRTSTVAAGLLITNYFANGNDDSFDIVGSITVNGRRAAAILGSTGRDMNIRISGHVQSNDYAIFAGTYPSYSGTIIRYNTNDRVEIAAGATVIGNIELFNGRNSIIIDSNARVAGNINADLGSNNVEIVLNDYRFGSGPFPALLGTIITSQTQIDSTVHFTLNLNSVDLSNGPREYKIYSGNMEGWTSQMLAFKYQGVSGEVLADGGRYLQDGLDVSSRIEGGEVIFTVNALPTDVAELNAVKNLTESYDHNAETVTLGWDITGTQGSFEVEYRITGGTAQGGTIVQLVSDSKRSITLSNIEAGQTVAWRIRQNIGNGDRTSVWSDGKDVIMQPVDYVYSKVEGVDFEFSGFSGASAVANLEWDPGAEYSEGLKGYVVRYFQVKNRIVGDIPWETTAVMTKYVTAPELLVSGLTNLQYFYWQVQTVDKIDENGEWVIDPNNWVDGEIFKVYDDDTTPPWFVDGQGAILDSAVNWADPTKIDPLETKTMDPYLEWASATDDRSGVSRYTLRFRVRGSGSEWISCDVPVEDDTQKVFTFQLSDWIAKNPTAGVQLLTNATYEWQLTAVDYAGQESSALTGSWAAETKRPVLDAASVVSTVSWNTSRSALSVSVKWDPATTETGYSKVLRYELQYRVSGSEDSWTTRVFSVKGEPLSWAGNLANNDWDYRLTAYNTAGNASVSVNGKWLADNVAPVYIDETVTNVTNTYDLANKLNTLNFTWSNATDNSATRPNSGMDRFELAYYDEEGVRVVLGTFAYDSRKALYNYSITVGRGGRLALPEGIYSWEVAAYDRAGNVTAVSGNSFTIDTEPPKGALSNLQFYGLATGYTINEPNGDQRSSGFGLPPYTPSSSSVVDFVVTDIYVDFMFDSTYADNSGEVVYLVQICDSAKFTGSRLYEFTTTDTTLRLDDTNGYGAGCMANTSSHEVYWRVMAMDGMGNATGNWYNGSMFYFTTEGYNITDIDNPTNIESTNDSVNLNSVYLNWSASSDIFGVEKYEIKYTKKGGTTTTISVSAVDISKTLTLADGDYTWSVRAVDYVGHTSAWTAGNAFTIDVTAPVWNNGAGLAITSSPGSKDIAFAWRAASDAHLAGYVLIIDKKTSTGNVSTTVTIRDPKATNYILYNQDDGDYSFTLYAADSFGNVSNASNLVNTSVDTSEDAGQTMATAKNLPWGVKDQQTIGGSDTEDWFTARFTGAATLNITVSGVANLNGKSSGVKLTVYSADGRKIKSYSVKPGDKALPGLLWDTAKYGNRYYLKVVSASSKSTAKYGVVAQQDLFETATKNVDFGSAASLKLTSAGYGSFKNGWVGFGDKTDYYKFSTTEDGALTVNLTMRQQTEKTKYKVTLYNSVGKKIKSVTVKGELGTLNNIFKKDVLALKGTYYLAIDAGDKGKGKHNGYYDFTVDHDYFLDLDEVNDGKSYTVSTATNTSISGWVGFGDASDTYLLRAGAGAYSVSINGVSAKLKVTLRDATTGKKVKSWSVSEPNKLLLDHSLLKGNTYLEVKASDNGKGKQNSDYSVSIVANEVFPKATNNNDLASATSVNFGKATFATMQDEWVGYGDAADFFSFQLDSASRVDLNLNLYNRAYQVGKDVKVKFYNVATGKTVKLDAGLTTLDTLEAGKYAVSVSISKPEKKWTGYDLNITKLA